MSRAITQQARPNTLLKQQIKETSQLPIKQKHLHTTKPADICSLLKHIAIS